MKKTQDLQIGGVYWVDGFNAPKVFNGLYFECLLTDQKIPANAKAKPAGHTILTWPHDVWARNRFSGLISRLKNQSV